MSTLDDKRFMKYRAGYSQLWRELAILPSRRAEVERTASRILALKKRYQAIEKATGVPWWFVAIVHKMEANLDFTKHLHNGDSLQKRTWQVPKGRPVKGSPPFTWDESAIDALQYDGLAGQKEWTLERVAYAFEKFNGFGYRKYGIPSPYLWSFTNRYARGKFVADGRYDPNAVSQQSGAMALLLELQRRDHTVVLNAMDAPTVFADEDEKLPRATDSKLRESRTLYGAAVAFWSGMISLVVAPAHWLSENGKEVMTLATEVAQEGQSALSSVTSVLGLIGVHWPWLGAAALVFGCFVVFGARVEAWANKKVG